MQKHENTCMRVTSIIIIILFIYFLATWHVGSYFPNQGVNLCPLQWKCGLNHWTTIAGRFFTIWATTEAKNTGVGSLSLPQGIFQTQESNWGLLHCWQILYQLSYQGRVRWEEVKVLKTEVTASARTSLSDSRHGKHAENYFSAPCCVF